MDVIYQLIVLKTFYPGEAAWSRSGSPFCRTYFCAARSTVLRAGGLAQRPRMKVGDRMGRFLPMGTTSVIVANGAALPPFVRVAFLAPPVQKH